MRQDALRYRLRVPEPCAKDWAIMQPAGTAARHCQACDRNVYNTAHLTARELNSLVERTGGTCCLRTVRSLDGSLLLRPEPATGVPAVTGLVLAAALAAGSGPALLAQQPPLTHSNAQFTCGSGREPATAMLAAPAPASDAAAPAATSGHGRPASPARTAELSGRIVPPHGKFQSGSILAFGGRGGRYDGTVAADGTYKLNVPPGRYEITAEVNTGNSRDDNWFGTETLTLKAGAQQRELRPSQPVMVTAGVPAVAPVTGQK